MARIRHLALRCRDMEESRRFYESVFGWKCIGYRPSRQGMDLTDGVTNITLLQQPADCDRPSIEEGSEYMHFGVMVEDLEAAWRRCRQWGAEASKTVKGRTDLDRRRAARSRLQDRRPRRQRGGCDRRQGRMAGSQAIAKETKRRKEISTRRV